jgi:protein TonB
MVAEDETIEALLLVSESQPHTPANSPTFTEAEAKAEAVGTAQTLDTPEVSDLVETEPMATSSVNSSTGSGAQSDIESSDRVPAQKSKPSESKTPKRASEGNYGGRVWAALARNKPKAGGRGSATVNFAIEASGQLNHVRVSESSGRDGLDQLALSTVRNSAPFPPPPNGRVSYTIRIDF